MFIDIKAESNPSIIFRIMAKSGILPFALEYEVTVSGHSVSVDIKDA